MPVKWWRVPLSPEVVGLLVGGGGGRGRRGVVVAGCNVTPVQRLDVCAHHRPRPVF